MTELSLAEVEEQIRSLKERVQQIEADAKARLKEPKAALQKLRAVQVRLRQEQRIEERRRAIQNGEIPDPDRRCREYEGKTFQCRKSAYPSGYCGIHDPVRAAQRSSNRRCTYPGGCTGQKVSGRLLCAEQTIASLERELGKYRATD